MRTINNSEEKKELEFSQIAWNKIHDVYQAIIYHPFNQEMILGTLDQRKFNYYIEQDYLFLQSFAKCLALIASRFSKDKDSMIFMRLAESTMVARQKIILPFLNSGENYKSLSISCLAYTNYLLQISAIQPIELAVSAVLPCYWIYHEVGKYIVQHTNLSNPFTKWISTYSREKFNQNLLEITKIFNELALNSTKETQQKMCNEFYKSSVLEWHFWNDAYNMKNYDNLNLCD